MQIEEVFNEPSSRTINATFDMDEKNLLPNETSIANDSSQMVDRNKFELKVNTKEPKEKGIELGFPPEEDEDDDDENDNENFQDDEDIYFPHPSPSKPDMIAQEPVVKSESVEISLVCWKSVICCYAICTLFLFSY